MMSSGLAIAWILMLLSFAAVQITLRKVVQPIEELSAAADRVAAGDLSARAPVAGDHEIATLGVAFNRMADELKARARTDELTALPNFRAFRERIDAELDRADRYPERFGSPRARSRPLQEIQRHLRPLRRQRRVAPRLTIDPRDRPRGRFRCALWRRRIRGDRPAGRPRRLTAIAERVRAQHRSAPRSGDGSTVTVSIGAAIYPDDASERDALFQSADARLYEAKKAGRTRGFGASVFDQSRSGRSS